MSQSAQIQVRIDPNIKDQAKIILAQFGLDISTAVKILMHQIVLRQYFPLRTDITLNGMTPEFEDLLQRETEEALVSGKEYESAADLHADILAEIELEDAEI
jgi:addiction module RelB/DinJ family antitoxin